MTGVFWPNGAPASTVPPKPGQANSGFRASSEYGRRTHPVTGKPDTFHAGIDLVGWTTILSPVDGVVTIAGWSGGYGNLVEVRRDNGDTFRMGHNASLMVRAGQRVTARQAVAIMGTTGNSTGVHCHLETRPGGGGATVNPRDYMAANAGGGDDGKDDDMPNRTSAIDRRSRTLTKGVWQTLYMNEAGTAASIATGRCRGISTAVVVASGLPPEGEIQFRLLKTKAGSSEQRGGTGVREAAATGGSIYATVTDNFELFNADDGIRWQYAVQYDGVTVTKTEVQTLVWPT